eukprot:48499-Amphidinium_carterae.2
MPLHLAESQAASSPQHRTTSPFQRKQNDPRQEDGSVVHVLPDIHNSQLNMLPTTQCLSLVDLGRLHS